MRKLLTILILALPLAAQTKDTAPRGLTSVTFANLGTPANGTIVYCSDCTSANPTAGSGTGAVARRENGAWNSGGGGGGGASITQGTFASLPGTCTTNDLYLITDSPIATARCSSTNTWSYFLSGVGQATPPVLGNFTWDNQASATTDTTHAGVIISNPTSETGIHVHALVKSAPSTPYHVITCFATDAQITSNAMIGLTFRNSSSGKMTIFGIFQGSTGRFVAFNITTSTGSVSTTPVNSSTNSFFTPFPCLRIGDDGTTNRTFDISGNGGVTWLNLGSESRTSQYTADQVGFYVNDGTTNTHFLHYAETN